MQNLTKLHHKWYHIKKKLCLKYLRIAIDAGVTVVKVRSIAAKSKTTNAHMRSQVFPHSPDVAVPDPPIHEQLP